MKQTLQQLLETKVESKDFKGNPVQITPDFRVSVQNINLLDGVVHVIIHPMNHNGNILDVFIKDDQIIKVF